MDTGRISTAGTTAGQPSGMNSGNKSGTSTSKKDAEILKTLRERIATVEQVDDENRQNYVVFTTLSSSNDQWPEEVKKLRGAHRPTLTFNRMNGIIKNVVGDYRQNKLAIKVIPSGGAASEQIADILAGLIRNIEMNSQADVVYVNGLECSSRGGFGWMRLLPEYEGADTFNQKLTIKGIQNPLTVFCDPSARERTRKDARWIAVTERMSKEEFKSQYPKASTEPFSGGDSLTGGQDLTDWILRDEIRVAEYYTKESVESRLVAFDSGAVVDIEDDKELEALKALGWNPVKERTAERTVVRWRKCSGVEVLEERVYKTQYIPLIPILGEEVNIEGKVLLRSLIYYAKDAQHMLNYWKTAATETVALAPKAPWRVTPQQIEGLKLQWDTLNSNPLPYILYNYVKDHPVPDVVQPKAPPSAELALGGDAGQELQYTTGVFDASLGQKSNAVSGVAEGERQSQSATSSFLFVDNLRSAIEHLGTVAIEWIRIIYDTERTVRILGLEGDADDVVINQKKMNPLLGITEVLNDIRVGKFDVVVEAGPAFASRRREAVKGMMDFIKALPQLGTLIADLAVKNMDWPGADEIAQRLKNALPPNVTMDPDSPEGKAALAQAQQKQQQTEQLQQTLLAAKVKNEEGKNNAEMAKSAASVEKSKAEVIKAQADTIQAEAEVHKTHIDASLLHLDAARAASQPGPVSQPKPAASPNHDEVKNMILSLGKHLIVQHAMNQDQAQRTHELLGKLADNHTLVAQALHRHNEIAAAPSEIIRDENGKAVASRKALPNA